MPVDRAARLLAEAGVADLAHPSGTLVAHLRGTYETLARWGCPEHLRMAGLFHSVYGTEAFRSAAVPLADRDRVRALIGEPAERVAHLYCVIVRRSLYENLSRGSPYRVVDRSGGQIPLDGVQQLRELLTLDLANRLEQLPRASMSLRRMESDRRLYERAAPLLPAAAVADLRRVYRRRSRALVLADGLVRRWRALRRVRRPAPEPPR